MDIENSQDIKSDKNAQLLSDSKKTSSKSKESANFKKNSLWIKIKNKKVVLIVYLLIVFMLTGLVGAGYFYWISTKRLLSQYENNLGKLNNQLQITESAISEMKGSLKEVSTLVKSIAMVKQQIRLSENKSSQVEREVKILARKFSNVSNSTRSAWKLAEVEYLLRLANQKLLMVADTSSAILLLQSVDKILIELDDYDLFSVRQALVTDLGRLKSIPKLDQETLYLRLVAMSKVASKIVLFKPKKYSDIQVSSTETNTEQVLIEGQTWKERLFKILNQIGQQFFGLFRITEHQEKSKLVVVSPKEEMLVKYSLQSLFVQAKTAFLSKQQKIYNKSLEQALELINNFYSNVQEYTYLVKEINELKVLVIKPELPSIHHALDQLQQFYDTKDILPQEKKISKETIQKSNTEKNIELIAPQQDNANKKEETQDGVSP